MNNEETRINFNEWLKNNYQPQIKLVTKDIDIEYYYFAQWLNGKKNMSQSKLDKVNNFIETN